MLRKQKTLFKAVPLLLGPNDVSATVRDESPEVDIAIRFLCYSLVKRVRNLFTNNLLYKIRDEWLELGKLLFQRGHLPLVISTLPKSATEELNIISPRPPYLEVTKIDDNGNVLIRPDWQPSLTSYYKKLSFFFSAAK